MDPMDPYGPLGRHGRHGPGCRSTIFWWMLPCTMPTLGPNIARIAIGCTGLWLWVCQLCHPQVAWGLFGSRRKTAMDSKPIPATPVLLLWNRGLLSLHCLGLNARASYDFAMKLPMLWIMQFCCVCIIIVCDWCCKSILRTWCWLHMITRHISCIDDRWYSHN